VDTSKLTRRQALKTLMAAGSLLALSGPVRALADPASDLAQTESDLSDAQAQMDAAQAQLDQIADDYAALAEEQSRTLDQIESKQDEIDQTQDQIDDRQRDLEAKQDRLAKRFTADYKNGDEEFLSILLNSTSLDDLSSNIYYFNKISDQDRQMIDEVKAVKAQLDQRKADLEGQKADLEALSRTQQDQLGQMQAKQEEVTATLEGLSGQVKDLMAQRDDQLAQMAAEKAAQAQAAREASAAGSGSAGTTGTLSSGGASTGSQQRVISACYSTPSPGGGLCAMWVSQVFSRAGYGYATGNACDMYNAWCHSSNKADLKPGMVIAVSSHSGTTAGRIYGHIGIYIGNGTVMHNVGVVATMGLDQWIRSYGTLVTPRWGWLMGIALA